VVALPDSTGQLQPVRFDAELIAPAPIGSAAAASKREAAISASAAAFASSASKPNSLTPREISRAALASQPDREASSRWGALLVAAVMLLATGAWFLTAGTFRRATLSSSESTTAAATQPAADKTEKVVPSVPAPAETPTSSIAEAATPAPATPAPAASAQLAATEDVAAPGPGLKNKPALTATVRGERVRRTSRSGKANAAPAPTGELPQGPTRAEVVTRLESVRPAVHACAAGRSGVADLDVTIAHTGLVMHVLVGGDFAGTTEGSCIARAVRQARFPAFKQERFRLLYPYAM
jgi:cytoskeletal protein RodZ